MKILKTFAASLVALLFATNMQAQLTQDTEGYQRFQLSFDAQRMQGKDDGTKIGDPLKTKGVALGFIKGINLVTTMPLFLELGGNIAWNHNKEKENDEEEKNTFMYISIPVQAAYKLTFSNSPISIVPFVGPNLKFNFMGKTTTKDGDEKDKFKWLKDTDDGGADAKIFQFGLNLGVGVNINRLYVGYTFQPDFSPYVKDGDWKEKTINNLISLGINF